jgi:DNA-binding NtrC family response regulator
LTGRIVLVDDDAMTLEVLREMLASWGLQSDAFGSFEEARTSLLAAPAGVLIVDIRLGAFNGLHLAHLAKVRNPGMTVIAVSGYDDPVLRAEAAGIGAAYLVKPIDPRKLRDILPIP